MGSVETVFHYQLLTTPCKYKITSVNKQLPFVSSCNKRPDFAYILKDRIVIIELDENAHNDYSVDNEFYRLKQLYKLTKQLE